MPEGLDTTGIETTAREIAAQCRRSVDQGMPLFLLVFYRHENQKLELLVHLSRLLPLDGLATQTLDPRHRSEHGAGRLYDVVAASGPSCVSLLFDRPLRPEGLGYDPDFLAYLNLHRDRIAREKLRLVLLLPSIEAELFVRAAGDLWDFRQHTWWLEGEVQTRGDGLWRDLSLVSETLPFSLEKKAEIDEHFERVRDLASRTDDPSDRAALLLDLAIWLGSRQAAPLALEVALEALGGGPDLPAEVRAGIEHEIGQALQRTGRPAEALPHYERSLALKQEAGDERGEARTLHNMAKIFFDWGDWQAFLAASERLLDVARKAGLRSEEAMALANMAPALNRLNRNEEARHLLDQSLAIAREIGDTRMEAIALNGIARQLQDQSDQEGAIFAIEESLALSRRAGIRAGEASALGIVGSIYSSLGRHAEARRALSESLKIRQELGDLKGQADALWHLAMDHRQAGEYQRAGEIIQEAVRIEGANGQGEYAQGPASGFLE